MSRHALILPKEEWSRIQDHFERRKVVPEEAMQFAYLDYMNRLNKTLTAEWKDSAENKMKQHEEKFSTALIDEKRTAWRKAGDRVAEANKAQRTLAVERAREMLFRQSDDCKSFQRAFYQTKSNHWVESQKKLNARIREEKKDINEKFEKQLLEECEAWKENEKKKVVRKRLLNLENKAELMKQIIERKERLQQEHDAMHKSDGLLDQEIRREIDIERKKIMEKKEKNREWLVNALDEGVREKNRKRATDAKISVVNNQINDIYSDFQHKFECLKDKKKKEVILERREMQHSLAEKLGAYNDQKEKEWQEYLNKLVEKYKRRSDKEARKDPLKVAAIRAERREIEADFMKPSEEQWRVKERKERKVALTNWEMANNLKNEELFAQLTKDFEKDRKAKQQLHWDSFTEQVDFKKKKKEQVEAEWTSYVDGRQTLAEAQLKELLDYAFEVVCECKASDRTTLPLMKFISDFKRKNGYVPLPPLPSKEMSHFPGYERPPDRRWYGVDRDCPAGEMRRARPAEVREKEKPTPSHLPAAAMDSNDPRNGLQKAVTCVAGPGDVGCECENILN